MKLFSFARKNQPQDIYHYRELSYIGTREIFEITAEENGIRVKNENVNCLFKNLSAEEFDRAYNKFNRYLNLDFDPVMVGNEPVSLTQEEQKKLTELVITHWIYFYNVNNKTIKVSRADFTHPYMVDYVLNVVDEKTGIDELEALALGAKLLRQNVTDYTKTVQARKVYYDR